jgi:hypothetical protein
LKCDGSTDDTAALNALDTTVYNAGGGTIVFPSGTCLIAGHVTLPNNGIANGGGYATQVPIHWTCAVADQNGEGGNPGSGCILKTTYSGAGTAKIETYGLGKFEIDHIAFYDTGTDSLPFLLTTGTTLNIHDNSFVGNCGGLNCTQDVILLGGFNSVFSGGTNDPTAAFQGYNSYIEKNYFQRIRRAVYAKTYAASNHIESNYFGPGSGSNLVAATLTLTSVANASGGTTTYTGTITGGASNGLATQSVVITGFTNPANNSAVSPAFPSAFNVLSSTSTTITVTNPSGVSETDPATAVTTGGSILEFDATAQSGAGVAGNFISGNRFEITSYAYGAKFLAADQNYISGNDFEDATVNTVALWYFDINTTANLVIDMDGNQSIPNEVVDNSANGGSNMVISSFGTTKLTGTGLTVNSAVTTRGTDPASNCLLSTVNNDQWCSQLIHGSTPAYDLYVKPAGATAVYGSQFTYLGGNNFQLDLPASGTSQYLRAPNSALHIFASDSQYVSLGAPSAGDLLYVQPSRVLVNNIPLKWATDGSADIGATAAARPGNIYAATSLNVGDSGPFGSNESQTRAACETAFAVSTLTATYTTGLNCLPANSMIDAVLYRITTGITGTTTSFTIGDGTVAARFCAAQSTLTVNTTGVCFAQADQTGTSGPRQVAAAKVVFTANGTITAGAMRLIVYYHTWTPPTS